MILERNEGSGESVKESSRVYISPLRSIGGLGGSTGDSRFVGIAGVSYGDLGLSSLNSVVRLSLDASHLYCWACTGSTALMICLRGGVLLKRCRSLLGNRQTSSTGTTSSGLVLDRDRLLLCGNGLGTCKNCVLVMTKEREAGMKSILVVGRA